MKKIQQFLTVSCLGFAIFLLANPNTQAQETKPEPKKSEENKKPQESTEEDEPTLEDAIKFIKSKLETHTATYSVSSVVVTDLKRFKIDEKMIFKNKDNYTVQTNNFSAEQCKVKWTLVYSSKGDTGNAEPTKLEFEVDLSKLDPANLKVEKVEPGLPFHHDKVFPDRKSVVEPNVWRVLLEEKEIKTPVGNEVSITIFRHGFVLQDRELAKRIVKAFQHAVKKCGGKVEPF